MNLIRPDGLKRYSFQHVALEYSIPKQQNTHYSQVHRYLQDRSYILNHKTLFNNFTKAKIIQSTFFDHNGMKLEITFEKKRKFTNRWRFSNMILYY